MVSISVRFLTSLPKLFGAKERKLPVLVLEGDKDSDGWL
jgi:hypothetical protein